MEDKLPYCHLLFLIQVGVLYSKITETCSQLVFWDLNWPKAETNEMY